MKINHSRVFVGGRIETHKRGYGSKYADLGKAIWTNPKHEETEKCVCVSYRLNKPPSGERATADSVRHEIQFLEMIYDF